RIRGILRGRDRWSRPHWSGLGTKVISATSSESSSCEEAGSSGAQVASREVSTGTESAERVADVLLAFSHGNGSMGVSKLARELALSKAVVHRILQSLVSRDLISFNPANREYSLGPSATVLGARALRQLDLRTVA